MKMLAEEKFLRDSIIEECGGRPEDILRAIRTLTRAVEERCAKKCDDRAALYRAISDKGPKEYSKVYDMDTLRMWAAEKCADAIRRRK